MGKQGDSGIDYVSKSWGCWRGCHHVSAGCDHCYGKREMKRFGHDYSKVVRAANYTFSAPLRWKEPETVFVCPWSDFFIGESGQWREDAWKVIMQTNHTYLIVTKRPERIEACLINYENPQMASLMTKALNRCWFIPTCENQEMLDLRWPIVADLKARGIIQNVGISIEPMLGPIDLIRGGAIETDAIGDNDFIHSPNIETFTKGLVDWVVLGCESGPKARYCDNRWMQSVVDQCVAAKVPVWVKQIQSPGGQLIRDIKLFPPGLRRREDR